ncbi:MAG: glycosyltransferase family 2 protein [Bacteroides sp.]
MSEYEVNNALPMVSIVIPLYNEEESLPELVSWIDRVVAAQEWRAELLLVDDGSSDGSWAVICNLAPAHLQIRAFRFQRNFGKSAALTIGFRHARGRVVFTMDADLQDSPDELPELYRMIKEQGYDLVSGWKKKRHDPVLSKNIPSKFFNATARKVTGVKLHDFNCGLKAYRLAVVKSVELYGDMHRYIPALAKYAGFRHIGEKVVTHYERKYGKTKFGYSRFVNGALDLLTLTFITRFGKRPMHLFGIFGSLTFLAGGVIVVILIVNKILSLSYHTPYRQIVSQPLFYIALIMVLLGAQLFLAGFLGELIVRATPRTNRYDIAETHERDV